MPETSELIFVTHMLGSIRNEAISISERIESGSPITEWDEITIHNIAGRLDTYVGRLEREVTKMATPKKRKLFRRK